MSANSSSSYFRFKPRALVASFILTSTVTRVFFPLLHGICKSEELSIIVNRWCFKVQYRLKASTRMEHNSQLSILYGSSTGVPSKYLRWSEYLRWSGFCIEADTTHDLLRKFFKKSVTAKKNCNLTHYIHEICHIFYLNSVLEIFIF